MAYTTIDNPILYFSTNLWVADDASSRALTGFGHQPDLVWTKHRGSGSINPTITDSVRGGDKQLATATTAAEDAGSHGKISAFGTDGITVIDGTSGSYPKLYFNKLNPFGASVGGNYVGWSWKMNGSGSSNTEGSLNTTANSVDTTAGQAIISYTGNGTDGATIGHGLDTAPDVLLLKDRDNTRNWRVLHTGYGDASKNCLLNSNAAIATRADDFNSTYPSSTLITLGGDAAVNGNTTKYIIYAFSSVKGYSKHGSYTGNGSTDGAFVYTGFRPAFIIIKNTARSDNWYLFDNKRGGFNVDNDFIFPDLPNAEVTSDQIDILSNGFKCRNGNDAINSSGELIIYLAFAESPFVNSKGVPTNAR
jgi:hypothetical protein